jgi:hypothetical protein
VEYRTIPASLKVNYNLRERLLRLHWQDFIRKHLARLNVTCLPNPVEYSLQFWTLFLHREDGALIPGPDIPSPFVPLPHIMGGEHSELLPCLGPIE